MTVRALSLSLGLHAAVLCAVLRFPPSPGSGEPRRPSSVPLFMPPPGGIPEPLTRGPRKGGSHAPTPGGDVSLDGIQLIVDDRYAGPLLAVLARWRGRITNCPAREPDAGMRFWLYDPSMWSETKDRTDLPCADFPPGFRRALASEIAAATARQRLPGPVLRAVIGFSLRAPSGLLVLRVEG